MAGSIRLWTSLCFLVQLALDCLSYQIETNKQILNNHLQSFNGIENIISCGRKCKKNFQCGGASFEERTSTCKLHFYSIGNPMITINSNDISSFWAITDNATRIHLNNSTKTDLETSNSTTNLETSTTTDQDSLTTLNQETSTRITLETTAKTMQETTTKTDMETSTRTDLETLTRKDLDNSTTTNVNSLELAMKFDVDTLHQGLYVSSNKTLLSGELTSDVKSWSPGSNQLTTYEGVIADHCIDVGQQLYYNFSLHIYDSNQYPEIEFGIADKATVDNGYTCGDARVDGWAFNMEVSLVTSLSAYRKGTRYFAEDIVKYGENVFTKGVFTASVNRVNNTFSLHNAATQELYYSFADVVSGAPLCPVFAITAGGYFQILRAYQIG